LHPLSSVKIEGKERKRNPDADQRPDNCGEAWKNLWFTNPNKHQRMGVVLAYTLKKKKDAII